MCWFPISTIRFSAESSTALYSAPQIPRPYTSFDFSSRPRRKTISRYNQLFSLQQLISSEGAETPIELVWGMGYAAWKKEDFGTPVRYPLLVQSCEIGLNEKSFDIEIRPRDVEPRLELDCYAEMELPGIRQLEAFWKSTLANGANRANPFEASTYEGVLKAAVGHLDQTGSYEMRTDDVTPPTPNDKLKVTNTWVLFARKRSGDIFVDDVRRLKKTVERTPSLPPVIRSFVERGDDTVREQASQPFRGLSTSDSAAGAFELYFPMAYNDEQVSIVQKLEANNGVVVQGPPGTGKTHTIANVICHYLAQGKRVLVTAKGESALSVLQEKLPERIRPLSVALLSDERDGMKQFEHSIQAIASTVASLNPARSAANIGAAEEKLNQLHAKIAHVDQQLSDYANRHMRQYKFQGQQVSPEVMAKLVLQQAEEHEWFVDTPPESKDGELPFGDQDISVLRQARIRVGEDISYLTRTLPAADSFPAWADVVGLHRDVVRARAIEEDVAEGSLLNLVDSSYETFQNAQELLTFVGEYANLRAAVNDSGQPWAVALAKRLAGLDFDDPVLTALRDISQSIDTLEDRRRDFLGKAIQVPSDAETNKDFRDALSRLTAGKSAFALPFGKGDARKLVAAVTALGSEPTSTQDWMAVEELMQWREEVRKALARWTSLSGEFGLPAPAQGLDEGFRSIVQCQSLIEQVSALVFNYEAQLSHRVETVFGKQQAANVKSGAAEAVAELQQSLQAHVDKGRLAYAMKRVEELLKKLDGHSGPVVEDMRSFLSESIGEEDEDEGVLQSEWLALQAELTHLNSLRPALDDILKVTAVIDAAGASRWADRLRTKAAEPGHDPQTPAKWLEAWNWRQACIFLERIDGHHRLRELFEERKQLTATLSRTYQDLVAEKTWLGVYNNSPNSIRQALQAYLNAVQSMGSGTGVRAIRHRRTAREAMTRAYQAVPCWVLPEWRVSETIPAEIGLFDLVVVDEASQSGLASLPALLRGKKVLIVGDHKQVSPSAVGTAEEKIKELSNRFLKNQPHGSEMTPDKSIYDLARVVFAGNSVMLKEHFRCVPAIIEFSNREFYQGDIKPLRLPKANERLDPPLIDVFVKGGFRQGDVNKPEAKAVVDEIEAILEDPGLVGRSIGVVTLLGTAQAAHLYELVAERISPADIVERKIAIGPPPVFQGRERDIMLISMVLAPGDRAAASKADMEQRFNVALSRARDRTYLFRSVAETAFKPESLNARLIRHFRQPFTQDVRKVGMLRERCESGFELEMFDALVQRGYRVEPQVQCGGYRIDFVVEGKEGRRLAVECDGDRFHGPGQWSDDMARQRVLERAGWTFWRCFASSFTRRREEVLADLWTTLDKLGIDPLGTESVDNTVWVHAKEVDPYALDELAAEMS
ncbi:AAA domain-containing protein [Cupriavidus necator]